MTKMYVCHQVANFENWKVVFDSMHDLRAQYGCTRERVFRGQENPNEVLIITEWPTKNHALGYGQSSDMKEGMKKAGVMGTPEINFSEN